MDSPGLCSQPVLAALLLGLWKVDDTATALLMTRCHENLLGRFDASREVAGVVYPPSGPIPKGEALREAKLWLRSLTQDEATRHSTRIGMSLASCGLGDRISAPKGRLKARPFEHPCYWAAFILVGDPG